MCLDAHYQQLLLFSFSWRSARAELTYVLQFTWWFLSERPTYIWVVWIMKLRCSPPRYQIKLRIMLFPCSPLLDYSFFWWSSVEHVSSKAETSPCKKLVNKFHKQKSVEQPPVRLRHQNTAGEKKTRRLVRSMFVEPLQGWSVSIAPPVAKINDRNQFCRILVW